MNILILGGGGREHALAWAFAQNPKCDRLWCAPGNAGIAEEATCVALDILDGEKVLEFALENDVGFVMVGPEAPLAEGVADVLREGGVATFGPGREAARLEASKAFTKEICAACGAPTAASQTFTDEAVARAYVEVEGAPIVVKADGLAAGKGVTVAETVAEALAALDAIFREGPGARVVIEEFMAGEEASFIVVADGRHALALATSQDHKRIGDGDTGPNTGGMGAYSPAPVVTPAVHARVMREVINPTIAGMAADGHPFSGFLYAGLMIDAEGKARVVVTTHCEYQIACTKAKATEDRLRQCPGCEVLEVFNSPISEVAQRQPPAVTAWVQKYGTPLYITSVADYTADYQVPPLRAGGVGPQDVILVSADGNRSAYERIRAGGQYQAVTASEPYKMQGYQAVDELNRAFHGQPPSGWVQKPYLVTAENVDAEGGDRNTFIPSNGYAERYAELWGVK